MAMRFAIHADDATNAWDEPDASDPMSKEEIVAILREQERASISFRDSILAGEQAAALDFYEAEPFGDEVEGRSQVVVPDVAEVVDYMQISVLRTVAAADRVVEFEPGDTDQIPYMPDEPEQPNIPPPPQAQPGQQPDPNAQAAYQQQYGGVIQAYQQQKQAYDQALVGMRRWEKQRAQAADDATVAVNHIFMRRQNGYRILIDWMQSGLIEKIGIIKTACVTERKRIRQGGTVSGDVLALMQQQGAPITNVTDNGDGSYSVVSASWKEVKRYLDYPIPSEEYLFAPRTRDEDEGKYQAHRCRKTLSDLIEMGFDRETVEALPKDDGINEYDDQRSWARWGDDNLQAYQKAPSMREVMLLEEYARLDMDDDGVAELYQIFRVGDTLLDMNEVEETPFVVWTPFPRAHRLVGNSLAEKTMDIQRIDSVLLRQALDGVYLTNSPRTWLPDEAVNENTIDDLLNVIPGAIVRGRGQLPPQPLAESFDIQKSLGMLEFMQGQRETRTGITRLNQGLDEDTINKMLCVETIVPMANGSRKRLGDIVDGDRIIGLTGSAVTVLKAHRIHNPERAYRITFKSGEQILSGGEHLWTYQDSNDRWQSKRWRTADTDHLFSRFKKQKGSRALYIPRVQRPQIENPEICPLDPYILGLWLGDGHSHSARFTSMDSEIVQAFREWAEERAGSISIDKHQKSGRALTYSIKGGLLRELKALNLKGNKHIPEAYFRASYDDRLTLLRGLMDTDGCHQANAMAIFSQKHGQLLADTFRLIESLGGWPRLHAVGVEGHYQIHFDLVDCPFSLSRKALGYVPSKRQVDAQKIVNIEPIDIRPMRCLTVDADDGLFCVGERFTVTHNTATGQAQLQAQGQQMEEFVARNFAEGMARLFAKKLRLMRAHGEPIAIKIEGSYRRIDPTTWDDDMNIAVRVGLGSGRKEQRLIYRTQIATQQAEAFAQGVPIVDPKRLYNNAVGYVRDAGLGNPDDFWLDPESDEAQKMQAAKPPQPDPNLIKAQAQAAATQQTAAANAEQSQRQIELSQAESGAKLQIMHQEGQQKISLAAAKAEQEQQLAASKAEFEAGLAQQTADRNYQIALVQEANRHELAKVSTHHQHEVNMEKAKRVPQDRPGGKLDK